MSDSRVARYPLGELQPSMVTWVGGGTTYLPAFATHLGVVWLCTVKRINSVYGWWSVTHPTVAESP